ncbi:hypothetical protein CRG98_027577 [Punica granatum]|uniref:Uncharacterized protein n=1 Tax=Punica granatum TaxID=22663 RepID=A0A2I0J712_PUNGR|nr:hypothetical protein CRG98_027577 [Punica granatum]
MGNEFLLGDPAFIQFEFHSIFQMLSGDLHLPKTLNPLLPSSFPNPLLKTLTLSPPPRPWTPKPLSLSLSDLPSLPRYNVPGRREVRALAGRSKKKPGGPSPGRIEGGAGVRREAKRNARRKSQKIAESLFYRLKNPNKNYADNFSEEELQMIGLGYDRMVRFMEKDDPELRHPYDWYKYGEYGPYSWRGVVVGEPIRGRFSDECVTMIGEVRSHEEWEKIEQFEMASEFGKRVKEMDKNVGFRYFWVFVRHPKWRISDPPWEQWTLISEVVLEAGKQRLDKWSLMGRLGNKARSLVTQCAAWMRPDIIYVKRPVYQCRFEPQDNFFRALTPFLDPRTEREFQFEVVNEDGSVELSTYFGGLCKIVKVNPKAFVDDVVKAYERLSDERRSECLRFLLENHPVELLHPYTKEWKAKLEEMELGCDAPDEEEDEWRARGDTGDNEIVDWIEDFGDDEDEDDDVIEDVDDEQEGSDDVEEDEKFWEEEFKKAVSSSERMELLAKRSVEKSTEFYRSQMKPKEKGRDNDGDETELRGKRAKVSPQEWKIAGIGPWRKRIKKSEIPPELFLKAAVRPFTYRNLVKEIVLMRHAILDGSIGSKA